MKAVKKFNTGVIRFNFEDEDGEVFSTFKMNPTDVNLAKRAEEVGNFFSEWKTKIKEDVPVSELAEYNQIIEEKINYLLGYDAKDDVFGEITATTISPDGEIFAFVLFDFIIEKLKPEIEKRKKNTQAAMNKYTEKYEK